MSDTKRKFRLKHGMALAAAAAVFLALALVYVVGNGLADRWARRAIVEQLEKTTGARVELGNFHFALAVSARAAGQTHAARTRAGGDPASVSCRAIAGRTPRGILLGPEDFAWERRDVAFLGAHSCGA